MGFQATLIDLQRRVLPYFPMSSHTQRTIPTERGMQIAERRIPEMAAKAGHEAYRAALRSTGAATVKTASGQVVERRSDGSVTVIKDLPVGKRVKPGTVLKRVARGS
ncbi:hypothetical protein SAMN04489708_10152 [Paracidovorax cattleyae]|uniref:Uncharacterized protein n=2 Tax=Paracidovorax cattleyae TaxID=80868 RepID=A0A1H0K2K7_9BURK|nr:hypothetical protein SAMN04489708_10152 [Paracidovorax cattleyae]